MLKRGKTRGQISVISDEHNVTTYGGGGSHRYFYVSVKLIIAVSRRCIIDSFKFLGKNEMKKEKSKNAMKNEKVYLNEILCL